MVKGVNRNTNKVAVTMSGGGDKYKVNVPINDINKQNFGKALRKSVAWEKVKALGNKASLKWSDSIGEMKRYIRNKDKYNPLKVYETGRVSFLEGRVTGKQYHIKNWEDASRHNLLPLIKNTTDTSQFAVGVILPDGKTQFRTLRKDAMIQAVENDFKIMSDVAGSDAAEQIEYIIDLSRDFRINDVVQMQDVPNKCNSQKNSIKIVGRCLVQDVYTRHNNCGFQVLKNLGFITNIKPKDQGGLSLNQMISLCKEYNFPVKIIDTYGQDQYIHTDFVDEKNTIVVSIQDQHYYIFKAFSMTKKELRDAENQQKRLRKVELKQQQQKCVILVFYDLETVFNSKCDNMAQTFSLSYFAVPLSNNMPKITADNINEYLDQTKILWGQDCCKQMVNHLQAKYIPTQYTYKFISFNGSCFDDYFLMDQAVDNEESVISCTFSNKSLLGLTLPYGKCWDLRKFLVGSLESNCKSFGSYPKKIEGFDHRLPQQAFDNGTLDDWISDNKQKIINYNKFDVLSLYSVTMKFRDSVMKLFIDEDNKLIDPYADVFLHDTIGQQALKLCKNKWKQDEINMPRPETEEYDKYIRKCLTAGRTQVMSTKNGSAIHLKGKKFQMIDVVSLYPYAMLNANNFYPCGTQTKVSVRDKTKLGFYHIVVKQRDDLPNVLPKRNYEGLEALDWTCKEQYETWCCSIDLDVLEEYDHSFTILDGLEFSDKISGVDLFACQLRFRDAKIIQDVNKSNRPDQYNEALREVCKLYLNSLSGKVIQRNFDKVTQIVKNTTQMNLLMSQCHKNTMTCHLANNKFVVLNGKKTDPYTLGAKPSYLGVYIYAHARKLMYTKIYTKVQTHYTDTDSALIYYDDYLTFRKENPELFAKETINLDGQDYEIKPFGTLDCEMNTYNKQNEWVGCDEAYLLAPKNYLVFNRQTQYMPKLKCKGVSFKGKYCKEHEKTKGIVKCEQCDAGYCKYDDGTPLYQDPVRLFEEMVKNMKCKVVCDQLTAKTFTNHHNYLVGIQFRQVTKTITIKSINQQ